MEVFEINPHIRYAKRKKGDFDVRRNISVCYDSRLFYFENVTGSITVNGEKYNVSNKTAIFLPPSSRYIFNLSFSDDPWVYVINFDLVTTYSYIKDSLGTAYVNTFDPEKVTRYDLPLEFSEPVVKQVGGISGFLSSCVECFEKDGSFKLERSSAMLKLALLEIIDTHNVVRSPLCEKILKYVRENYSDTSMTNESIADRLNYHPYYVNRIFKRELGISLRSYIIDYRISVAKNLLALENDSISEIAYRAGFSSPSYFVKTFKERVGMTPRTYRKTRLLIEL